jgi:hypothetical protein
MTGAITGGIVSFVRELSQNFDTRGVNTWNGIAVGSILSGGVGEIINPMMINLSGSEAKSAFIAVRIVACVVALIGVLSPVLEFFNHYTFQAWYKVRSFKLNSFYSFILLILISSLSFYAGLVIREHN